MSDTDSFIDEVTEEVRRDKLFATFRKYGWIAVAAVVLIVGGASWREYQRAQDTSQARALGDGILAALQNDDAQARVTALSSIEASEPGAGAVLDMLISAEQANAGDEDAATESLRQVATRQDIPAIYRQIANYKALARGSDSIPADQRRLELETLAIPGSPLRLLAEEQLAILDIEEGRKDAAIDRLQDILADSEVTTGLRRRASQLIVALGGTLGQA